MKKAVLVFAIPIIFVIATSCSGIDDKSLDGRIKTAFSVWAKKNINGKYKLLSISYDTVGTPLDYLYRGAMLCETVGSSGKSNREVDTGSSLILLENILDSAYLTTPIHIAKISVGINNDTFQYYLGLRGDSIYTEPQLHGYEALRVTQKDGELYIYDACRDISLACLLSAKSQEIVSNSRLNSDEGYYDFWKALPGY